MTVVAVGQVDTDFLSDKHLEAVHSLTGLGNVQLKHIVISFGTKLNLPWKKIRKLTLRTIGQWKECYQMFYGMHYEVNDEGKGYWRLAGTTTLSRAISNKRRKRSIITRPK